MLKKSEKSVVLLLQHDQPCKNMVTLKSYLVSGANNRTYKCRVTLLLSAYSTGIYPDWQILSGKDQIRPKGEEFRASPVVFS